MEKLLELDERLSGVYSELHGIHKEMGVVYEDEDTQDHKVSLLAMMLEEITKIQQDIEDEVGEEVKKNLRNLNTILDSLEPTSELYQSLARVINNQK